MPAVCVAGVTKTLNLGQLGAELAVTLGQATVPLVATEVAPGNLTVCYAEDPAPGTQAQLNSAITAHVANPDWSPTGGVPWRGRLHVAWGAGDPCQPAVLLGFQNTVVSVAGPTPTQIGTTVGRLVSFRFDEVITPTLVRWFGVAAVSNLYTLALYNGLTGKRLWTLNPANTVAGWSSAAIAGVTFEPDVPYWLGLGAKAVGTTAGFRTPASPIASCLSVAAPPGRLASHGLRFAQVTLAAGVWPDPLPAVAAGAFASAGATGTLPLVFLEA